MTAYLDQLTVSSRPGDRRRPRRLGAAPVRRRTSSDTDPASARQCRCDRASPHRVLQDRARRPARPQAGTGYRARRSATASGCCAPSSNGSSTGTTPTPQRRVPVFAGDIPKPDEPLPKFLDDPTAAKFMAALAVEPNPRRRLIVELLARTGMRVRRARRARRRRHGPPRRHLLAAHPRRQTPQRTHRPAAPDARRADQRLPRLARTPPQPVCSSNATTTNPWTGAPSTATSPPSPAAPASATSTPTPSATPWPPNASTGACPRSDRRAARSPITWMTLDLRPHLRHHRRRAVLHRHPRRRSELRPRPPATGRRRGTEHAPPRRRSHRRLLGNGHCTRPATLDCRFQTICERCGFFETGPQFVTILRRQRDNAPDQHEQPRADLYNELLDGIDTRASRVVP